METMHTLQNQLNKDTPAQQLRDLAEYAMKHPKWWWMNGVQVINRNGRLQRCGNHGFLLASDDVPDFRDEGTMGCLRAMVQQAWLSVGLHTRFDGVEWSVWIGNARINYADGKSLAKPNEAFALVAAFWVAPN